ncbi:LTA synthase family protein, partial [Alphaproteobacteria bacterium]|nr:LTA synthase family protein [Alphaproteobacteria bacterium]
FNSLFFKDFNINTKNSFIENNYVEYRASNYKSENKNLVIIYVESLENTFSDEEIFGEDLLFSISNENINGRSVDKFIEVEGYGFTIASLIATQCGLPLKSVGLFNSTSLDVFEDFLPNLKCLSDIFKLNNYHNVFLTSDELKGSGFKNFLNSHNYDETYGLQELKKLGYKTSKTAWHNKKNWYGGIHDDELLRATLDNIKKLEKKNSNYFVTVFTLDTHAPEGYLNPKCVTELSKDQEITLAVKCTVLALKNFIKDFNALKLKNTNLVVLGDHLFMAGSDGFNNEEYFKSKERYIYNKFISNENKSFNRDYMNFFDLYPSLLEYSGFKIENGRLGLGSSIFSEFKQDLYLFEDQNFLKKLSGESKFYNKLWQ